MRFFAGAVAAATLLASSVQPVTARASAFEGQPKLVVVLVLDQFRGGYLDRYRADFKTRNGFNLFLQRGAYFPECYYGYANTMTAPGHSSIGTGAYTNGHNIATNDWWDVGRVPNHMVSSVEDAEYPLVGASVEAERGASPRNELATTLGDEVVLATGGRAKLFGVSLKDRAAILTSGHASQGAYWIDHATGRFETSTYWRKDLPAWVASFNDTHTEQTRKAAGNPVGDFYEKVGLSPLSVQYELDFAKTLVQQENLGRNDVTDVLTLSISSTDILGHEVGPDAPEMRAMIDATDGYLDSFFTFLQGHVPGGLANVMVAMTADHGVANSPGKAASEGIPAASFSAAALNAELNRALNAKLATKKSEKLVLTGELPFVNLDQRVFARLGVTEEAAERMAADLLPSAMDTIQASRKTNDSHALHPASIRHTYTRTQFAAGDLPNTEEGKLLVHSVTTNGGWWIYMTPSFYAMSGHEAGGTTHYSPYSYDRHVPLAFFGAAFVPGTYLQHSEPVDIAATFAALLRVNQPSASVGRVLTEAIRPAAGGGATPRIESKHE